MRELCESPFERAMFDELSGRGYRVIPQVKVGGFRIDMVVEGHNDARLAVECDGDRYHGADKWDEDMHRQRILERAGWRFWRCFASTFIMHREELLQDLVQTLTDHVVEPIGADGTPRSIHTEYRTYAASKNKDEASENEEIKVETEVPAEVSVSVIGKPTKRPQTMDEVVPVMGLNEREDETDSLKVRVGDFINYIDISAPDNQYHIQIVSGPDHLDAGIINEARPLAQSMLNAEEGDNVELNVPGRPSRIFKIVRISRPILVSL